MPRILRAEANDFDAIERLYHELRQAHEDLVADPALVVLSPGLLETFGLAGVAHAWPALALLEYGRMVLEPLGPKTVYVGGTDEGRFIPTLLNATSSEPSVGSDAECAGRRHLSPIFRVSICRVADFFLYRGFGARIYPGRGH